jgi:chromosome partitioning protein
MPKIAIASSKGGAGRTTLAIVLATTLAQKYSVILIDADPDHRLMSWFTKAPLPARLMVRQSAGPSQIATEITAAATKADFVIVDLDDTAVGLDSSAVRESDLVIIPMGDEPPDAEATDQTLAQLARQARALGREIPVRVLFTRTEERAVKSWLAQSINARMRDNADVLFTELHDRPAYSYLNDCGGTLQDMDPEEVAGLAQAMANAEMVAEEVKQALNRANQKSSPSVQMSIRMKADVYERFRALCQTERRTNGEMLEVLLEHYWRQGQGTLSGKV